MSGPVATDASIRQMEQGDDVVDAPHGEHPSAAEELESESSWNGASVACLVVVLVLAVIGAMWMTWSSFDAKFGPIDDHEPLSWMGPDGKLSIGQYWNTFIRRTEIGDWGAPGRFRPSYYAVRVGEAVLFGNHPRLWYLAVFAFFVTTCVCLAATVNMWARQAVKHGSQRLQRWAPLAIAISATVCALGMRTWSGILGRLGPSELLGLAALSVALLGATKLSFGGRGGWWPVLLTGVTLAVLAKESFVCFSGLPLMVGAYRYASRGRRKADLIAGSVGILPALLLAIVLVPHLADGSGDVYGDRVGASRLTTGLSFLDEAPMRWFWVSLAATVVSVVAWMTWYRPRPSRPAMCYVVALLLWSVASMLFDTWFYGGYYWAPRYFAVIDLFTMLLVFGATCLAASVVLPISPRAPLTTRTLLVVPFGLMLIAAIISATSTAWDTRNTVTMKAADTRAYEATLESALSRVNADTDVVVVVRFGFDYEPALAIASEIGRRRDGSDRQFVLVNADPADTAATAPLQAISQNGAAKFDVSPLAELPSDANPVCIFVNAATSNTGPCTTDRSSSVVVFVM